jgi:hypothetical protein
MAKPVQVFLILPLHHRVVQWDELSQAEFAAFQDQLREHGILAILGNERMCAVEEIVFDEHDAIARMDFWLKHRGQWMFLSLEVRSEDVFVLHDTKPGSGP